MGRFLQHGLLCPFLVTGVLAAQKPAGFERPDDFDKRVSEALDRARPLLLDQLASLRQGRLALACHALLNDGVTMKEPLFAAAIARLSKEELFTCYALSLRLMVIQELRTYPDRRRAAARDCKNLLKRQGGKGGFTYTPDRGGSDLSNTQYAALGLRSAQQVGVQVSPKRWERLARYAAQQQGKDGGGYYSRKKGSTRASMTVALIAVLEICKPHLKGGRAFSRSEKGIKAAWGWMERRARSIGAGAASMNNYYYHYGLERAAILSTVFDVGKVDWYWAGAEMMLLHQADGGGWNGRGVVLRKGASPVARPTIDAIQTSFAILFLRRRFQKTLSTPTTNGSYTRALFLPEKAGKTQVEASVRGEVSRGYPAVPGLIKALSSGYLTRRKAAAKAFIQITGRFEDLSPYVKPEDNEESLHAIEAWWMREGHKKLDHKTGK